jgi:hypothetical protein
MSLSFYWISQIHCRIALYYLHRYWCLMCFLSWNLLFQIREHPPQGRNQSWNGMLLFSKLRFHLYRRSAFYSRPLRPLHQDLKSISHLFCLAVSISTFVFSSASLTRLLNPKRPLCKAFVIVSIVIYYRRQSHVIRCVGCKSFEFQSVMSYSVNGRSEKYQGSKLNIDPRCEFCGSRKDVPDLFIV